jgi:hypothetical protein
MNMMPKMIEISVFPKIFLILIISFSPLQGKTQTLDVDKTYDFSPNPLRIYKQLILCVRKL